MVQLCSVAWNDRHVPALPTFLQGRSWHICFLGWGGDGGFRDTGFRGGGGGEGRQQRSWHYALHGSSTWIDIHLSTLCTLTHSVVHELTHALLRFSWFIYMKWHTVRLATLRTLRGTWVDTFEFASSQPTVVLPSIRTCTAKEQRRQESAPAYGHRGEKDEQKFNKNKVLGCFRYDRAHTHTPNPLQILFELCFGHFRRRPHDVSWQFWSLQGSQNTAKVQTYNADWSCTCWFSRLKYLV